jgi:hypothetical protein
MGHAMGLSRCPTWPGARFDRARARSASRRAHARRHLLG